MHGHPFPGPTQLWWGAPQGQELPRNLFAAGDLIPPSDWMFTAGGLIDAEGKVTDRAGLHLLMKRLAERIRAEPDPSDNAVLPSGYTYLLQFIAHDLVDSVTSFNVRATILGPGSRNARPAPLLLDTLYGAGPDECPQAYEFGKRVLRHIPRTRLRVGPTIGTPPVGIRYCPFRDVARAVPNSADQGFAGGPALLVEAMLADPRNDAHALISQLVVVFQLLHNHILSIIERHTQTPSAGVLPRREVAYRQFHCARSVVTLVYRNIIEKDVLQRVLHPRIFTRYVADQEQPVDCAESIPLEFTFGAFRFGHSM